MSSGKRGAFFAAGLIVGVGLALLFLVWAVPDFRDPSFADKYYEQWQATTTDNPEEQDKTSRTWIRGLRGWVYTEDTAAQWLMALLGFSATVVSLLALIWLKATWAETKRSADAAERAADIAREIGQAQVRAYITCTGGEALIDKSSCTIALKFENRGQSPAFDIRVIGRGTIRNLPLNDLFDPARSDRMNGLCDLIASGDTGKVYLIFVRTNFTPVAYQHLFDRRATIDFMIRVRWKDVFKDEQSLWLLATISDLTNRESPETQLLPLARIGHGWNAKLSVYNRPAPGSEPEPEVV